MKIKITAIMLICFVLFIPAVGCGSTTAEDSFTLADLKRLNSHEAVFGTYSSIRTVSTFYDFEAPGMDRGDFTQYAFFVRGENGINVFVGFSFGYAYAIVDGNVFLQDEDGDFGIIAFFDDGYFETYYLPIATDSPVYQPTEGEEIVSVTVENGIRRVITHVRASNAEDFDMWGLPDGIIESIYELDTESGLLIRETNYLTPDGGERRLLAESEVVYGEHDDFELPEYVVMSMDMSATRTMFFVQDVGTADERIFTFVLPKAATAYPATMEEFEYFWDAEFTVPYVWEPGGYPDEMTLYMQRQ